MPSVAEKTRAGPASDRLQYKPSTRDCVRTCFTPCVSYARTNARLDAAGNPESAAGLEDDEFYNSDCATMAFLCPGYSCLISRLQQEVRSFYGDKNGGSCDWLVSCCCPGYVLSRAEAQIVGRQKEFVSTALTREYLSQPPMEVVPSDPSDVQSPPRRSLDSVSVAGRLPERSASLATITEASRETSLAGYETDENGNHAAGGKKSKAAVTTKSQPRNLGKFPLLKYLDAHYWLVPVESTKDDVKPDLPVLEIKTPIPINVQPTESGHSILRRFGRSKTTAVKAADPSPDTKHDLTEDTRSARAGTVSSAHRLAEDEQSTKASGSRFAEHMIGDDHTPELAVPSIQVSHAVSEDPVSPLPGASHQHGLNDDAPSIRSRSGTGVSHTLDVDEQVPRNPKTPEPSEADEPFEPRDKPGFVTSLWSNLANPLRGSADRGSREEPSKAEDESTVESAVKEATGGITEPMQVVPVEGVPGPAAEAAETLPAPVKKVKLHRLDDDVLPGTFVSE